MKKKISIILSTLIILSVISILPSYGNAYTPFNPIISGDQLSWELLDYNETINSVDPGDWYRTSDWVFMGKYVLNIGDIITFQVDNSLACNGSVRIGNLSVSSVTREDIGFNLNLVTGPAYPPYLNYSWNPAFISSTNWDEQIELANNASNQQGASLIIQTANKTFLGQPRAVISFNYSTYNKITNVIYDNETGILLYLYTEYSDITSWWLEMSITIPSGIPSFEIFFSAIALCVLVLILFYKSKFNKILNYNTPK
ncbi:MAG: hypothetical protein ACFFD2_06030 [Promethearchaeota archaeon]